MSDNLKKTGSIIARSLLMKASLPVLLIAVFIVLLIVVVIASVASSDMGKSGSIKGQGKELPDKVVRWEDDIQKAMDDHDLDDKYLPVMLAILNQESGGDAAATDGDIFQSSESKCGSIGCIFSPEESIDQAVKYFKKTLKQSNGNLNVAIASYNFGNDFADWTQKHHDNKWSKDIAIEYSQHMMDEVSNPGNYSCIRSEAEKHDACYGDINYVPTIKAYVPEENGGSSEGNDFEGKLSYPIDKPIIVTSYFGNRELSGDEEKHDGVDLNCVQGVTPIKAAGNGKVVYSNQGHGYGNSVIVKHDDGFYTHYAHMSELKVSKGDSVRTGSQVGICGSTGHSTGAHLHFETKGQLWGDHQNPRDYINFPSEQ